MSWYYEGRELTSDDLVGMAGFVYEIHDLDTDRIYVGQKKASSRRKVNPTRKNGLKRPRRVTSESDWQEYWGSNEELKKLVSEHGPDRFRRVVLRLCKTKAEMSYYEMREQIMRDVLLKPDRYFNRFVGGKIHGNHLRHLQESAK